MSVLSHQLSSLSTQPRFLPEALEHPFCSQYDKESSEGAPPTPSTPSYCFSSSGTRILTRGASGRGLAWSGAAGQGLFWRGGASPAAKNECHLTTKSKVRLGVDSSNTA